MWDRLYIGGHAATMTSGGAPYGAIRDAAVAVADGALAWVGPAAELPRPPAACASEVVDLDGAWITPGLIDCHTHLVFAGARVEEWERRLHGASYEEIARAGGGILSTVTATRAATVSDLVAASLPRLERLVADGVTTVEIKSGYGLDAASERRMLEAAGALAEVAPVRVVRTLLALHALPPEFKDDRAGYVDLVCDEILPGVARDRLADAVDAYCDTVGFTVDETRRVFEAAAAHGLRVKLHAEQLSNQHGAALAAAAGALSADHLEHLDADGVAAMAAAGTVAVLLPGAFYALKDTKIPPVDALRAADVPVAIGSDLNPGTSPVLSLLTAANMGCMLFALTPEEALAGITRNAARALGREPEIGTIEAGKRADLAVWRVESPAELVYWIGGLKPERRVFGGRET